MATKRSQQPVFAAKDPKLTSEPNCFAIMILQLDSYIEYQHEAPTSLALVVCSHNNEAIEAVGRLLPRERPTSINVVIWQELAMELEEDQPRTTNALFRSFLLVAGAYIFNLVCLCLIAVGLASTMFPKTMLVFGEPEKFNAAFQADPTSIFPRELIWILLGASVFISFGLGYLVARLAPISKFPHAIFFAMILFGQYLQLAIGAIPTLQTPLILFMATSPVAALLGANVCLNQAGQE